MPWMVNITEFVTRMLSSKTRQLIAVSLSFGILISVMIIAVDLIIYDHSITSILGSSFNGFVLGLILVNEPKSQQYLSSWKGKVVFLTGGLVMTISFVNIGFMLYHTWPW